MTGQLIKPDYLFETSWEVCNKIGGIYAAISTKASSLVKELGDNYILIGPEVMKDTSESNDFTDDPYLYKSWREKAESDGLRFRVGRWSIAGNPVVILVDFTPYFPNKNKIFAHFWESYKLDSIAGQWDYVEPALFGYAAARVIESFYEFYLTAQDRLVAQFHEWMTGAGILYLKEYIPQASTVFTTHATILGRSIAGNGMPLYRDLAVYDPETMASNLGVRSKFSLEKLAASECDTFTTVSPITANECHYFLKRDPDIITPNGFDDFFVPVAAEFTEKRLESRNTIIDVAKALFNQDVPSDSILILNSGRYELKNKGIDLFIKALGRLNAIDDLPAMVLAVIAVPSNHQGPRQEVIARIDKPDMSNPLTDEMLTHGLHDVEHDSVIRLIKECNLHNTPQDHVKVMFVPSYLNGNDGIFNLEYYDFLIGFDISVFPSYYEPWGYTPLESLAFHIPTIITSLSGFGQWVHSKFDEPITGIDLIDRGDDNDDHVIDQITEKLEGFSRRSAAKKDLTRKKAWEISRIALWENLIQYYFNAFSLALRKTSTRSDLFKGKQHDQPLVYKRFKPARPNWRKILVNQEIPKDFIKLQKLSWNLWWTWNYEASDLFEMIDPHEWRETNNNPIALLESLSMEAFKRLQQDHQFMEKLDAVYGRFESYLKKAEDKPKEMIAYFSMEYGLHDTLKIYSGGLGILSGDYLKEASDNNINIIGVGLMYRYGFFTQKISIFGDQVASYNPHKFSHLPLLPVRDSEGNWIKISISLPGRIVYAKVWRVDVGRVPLYLMDTDIPENSENDRSITHQLYGGDVENRLKQELLLGVGGIRMLDSLDIEPDIYHCNEGHAAFIGLERLRKFVQGRKFSFQEALEIVRSSSLFTTHTPVPAGHDAFTEDLLRAYIPHYADRLKLTWEDFMNLGRFRSDDTSEKFSMSVLAARLSQEMNGVSRIHGKVSQEMFQSLYEGYYPAEINIGYVTNGVHYATWTSADLQKLYRDVFGEEFLADQSNPDYWGKIHLVNDNKIWNLRQKHRKILIDYVKDRISKDMTIRQENPKLIIETLGTLSENAMTIGFARRFATYKRAHLLFSNLERLASIVNIKGLPVQFIFAGKAHPHDRAGQDLIKKIIEVARRPEFAGKIIFVENYDIELAKKLVSGVDVWLNTPTRPLEASGTSGEKAVMNGVVNFSVLDGWWAEGYRPNAGFAVPDSETYNNLQFQNELDAEIIYNMLEDRIIPLFYERDKNIPAKWIGYIKNTISGIAPYYTTKRMMDDYFSKFYIKMFRRAEDIKSDDFHLARKIASWKRKVLNAWENIEVISINVPDPTSSPLKLGKKFTAEIILDLNELSADDIGIEVVFGQKENDEVKEIMFIRDLKMMGRSNGYVTYFCEFSMEKAGVFDYAFRVFPKSSLLAHRQSFGLVKWI
jgi:phosphorylase/glycogen(starch) synthase